MTEHKLTVIDFDLQWFQVTYPHGSPSPPFSLDRHSSGLISMVLLIKALAVVKNMATYAIKKHSSSRPVFEFLSSFK